MKKQNTNKTSKEDWRGEKGKYYDLGFEEGKAQAKKEFIEMIEKLRPKYIGK